MEKRDTLLELVSASGSENTLFWREYLRVNSTRTISMSFATYFEQTRISQGLDLASRIVDCSFDHSPTDMAPKVKKLVKDNDFQIIDEIEYRIQFCKIAANVPLLAGSIKWTHSDVKLVVDGDADEIDAFVEKFEALFFNDGVEVGHVQGFKESGFPTIPAFRLRDLESQIGKNHYYPWLEEQGYTLESFAEAFKASNKNVLLLIGDPGTGKSTFLRTLILNMNSKEAPMRRNYIVTDEAVLRHELLMPWLEKSAVSGLTVVEDADNFVEAREKGNTAMSALLSVADGIIPIQAKLAISTNLASIKRVDPALIRPGRAFKILSFRLLTAEEAVRIRELDGLEPVEFDASRKYSLAEVLNYEAPLDLEERKRPRVGFIQA